MWFLVKFLLFSALALVMLVALLGASASGSLGVLLLIGLVAGCVQFVATKADQRNTTGK